MTPSPAAVPPPLPLVLQPFSAAASPAKLTLSAAARRHGRRLTLQWQLAGELQAVALPEPGSAPQRRDELWTRTCLEAFLAAPGDEVYRELNLCPSGDWNLYRLEGYRRGLRPDAAQPSLPCQRQQGEGWLQLEVTLDLERLLGPSAADGPLELSFTAVIAGREESGTDGPPQAAAISYWALHHPAAEPDFHHRGGFVLPLPAEGT
ncbi:MAG: DOMON-like domain-containing protein [Synechococcaceae cyanobacterium]|nr:DOMON-like domain-containing protein [Synechococcaceae cyanobacterium]